MKFACHPKARTVASPSIDSMNCALMQRQIRIDLGCNGKVKDLGFALTIKALCSLNPSSEAVVMCAGTPSGART